MKFSFIIAILFLFSGASTQAQTLNPKLKSVGYVIGKWQVKAYRAKRDGSFNKPTTGKAEFSTILDGTFIRGKVKTKGLTMFELIGVDPRSKELRLFALDKEFGVMDVYKGTLEGKNMRLSNLKSDALFVDKQGNAWAFRLNYTYQNNNEFSLLVEFSIDKGKTWKSFQKNVYSRVSG